MEERIILAGGCFWCMVNPFTADEGVLSVISGYSNGHTPNPTYEQVCREETGHTEAVLLTFNNEIVSLEEVLTIYWRLIDPTDNQGQFEDRGSNYRPAIIFFTEQQRIIAEKSKQELIDSGRFEKPIVVPIEKAINFYPAEDYHQDYFKKHPELDAQEKRYGKRHQYIEKVWK